MHVDKEDASKIGSGENRKLEYDGQPKRGTIRWTFAHDKPKKCDKRAEEGGPL